MGDTPREPLTETTPTPGDYADYKQVLGDPNTRAALLTQVKGTVGGLRGGYRWHVIASIVALVLMIVGQPGGWVGEWRSPIFAAILLIDVLALAALRTVATTPTRFLFPLILIDLLVVGGLLGLSIASDSFRVGWIALLLLPAMLLVYARDAWAIAPILKEHAAFRRTDPRTQTPEL